MAGENIFEIVEADTLPTIPVTLEGVDITGYTMTLQVMQTETGSPLEKVGTISDAAAGAFFFQFATVDLIPGLHPARIVTDDGAAGIETFRGFFIRVPEVWV